VTESTTIIPIVDADTHLTEPPDLWTARIPAKYRDGCPRVEIHPETGNPRWRLGDRWLFGVGDFSRFPGYQDERTFPSEFDEIDPACWDAKARLSGMDSQGIYGQVVYPNFVAFEGYAIMALPDKGQQLAVVSTYNDYLVEWAEPADGRFVLNANLPFWDLEASVAEMRRCKEMGFSGIVWAATLDRHSLPTFYDPYWDPLYAVAQDLEMSINFHVGIGYTEEQANVAVATSMADDRSDATYRVALGFMSNTRTIAKLVMFGLCERFPRLPFVSVESGFGFVPFLIEALDWQWKQLDGPDRAPGRLLPSEYFARQIYTMFWFEQGPLSQLPSYADNVMFETDFPHNTCLVPNSRISDSPREIADRHIKAFGTDVMQKVLYDNAAKIYHLPEPPRQWLLAQSAVGAG
jgi:predicted TIM-barrel fold metal-dependent hydrolase